MRWSGLRRRRSPWRSGGTHPSPSGRAKVANLLQQFFTTSNLTVPWYLSSGTVAAFTVYGAGCSGTSGVPVMRSNGVPQLGNLSFAVNLDNGLPRARALDEVKTNHVDPVVQVIDQSNSEIVYTVRIKGSTFTPKVGKEGVYTVRVFDPDQGYDDARRDQRAQ